MREYEVGELIAWRGSKRCPGIHRGTYQGMIDGRVLVSRQKPQSFKGPSNREFHTTVTIDPEKVIDDA